MWTLRNLAVLSITSCKQIDSIEGIQGLKELQNVTLDALPWLRQLDVHGSTTISDGRLAFLKAKGVQITFAKRKHYDVQFFG